MIDYTGFGYLRYSTEEAVTELTASYRRKDKFLRASKGSVYIADQMNRTSTFSGGEAEMRPLVRFAQYAKYYAEKNRATKQAILAEIEDAATEEILYLFREEQRLFLVIAALAYGFTDEENLRAAAKLPVRIIYTGDRPAMFGQSVEVIALAAQFEISIEAALEFYKANAA